MSVPDFTASHKSSALVDMLGVSSSMTTMAVSSSPSIAAGMTVDDRERTSDDVHENFGIPSNAIGLLGRDIGCDFYQHSSSSERSSISASPGPGLRTTSFSGFNVQATTTMTTAAASASSDCRKKNAGGLSSPSASSSEAESSHHSRPSSKSNATATSIASSLGGGGIAAATTESNKNDASGPVSPVSPLGDFRGYDLPDETSRNSDVDDGFCSGHGGTNCQYCRRPYRQPRLLFCLHSFCEDCILAMLEGRSEEAPVHELDVELEPTKEVSTKPPPGVVRCPVCKQDSNVGNDLRFVQLLTMDYVTTNMQDANAMEQAQLSCESCKAKEQAIAHCFDCSSFLCPNCVKAHQYMRCFENHKVLTVDQIKQSGESMMIHRPILCQEHAGEHIRYFCITCKVPVCIKCTHTTHKAPDHVYEDVGGEVEMNLRQDLESLVKEGHQKVQACVGASRELNTKVRTVQDRAEAAVQAVEEAYSAYLEVLARRRDELIKEIGQAHGRVEEEIMDTFSRIGNMSEKINDALSFTERLLRCGNGIEILYTRKAVRDQLTFLIRGIPSTNVAINLKFVTDTDQFERAMKENFGVIRTEVEPPPIERVNVDELLKKINTVGVGGGQGQGQVDGSSTQQSLRNDTPSVGPYGSSAFMAVDAAAAGGGGRMGGTLLQPVGNDNTSFFQYGNYSRMATNAGAPHGNTDFFAHGNNFQGGGLGLMQSSNSNISPVQQHVGSGRPPSCAPGLMGTRSTSAASPIDGGGFGTYLPNGAVGVGGRVGNDIDGGNGGMPNLSMPPPIRIGMGGPNVAVVPRRTPPTGFDLSSPLVGLPPTYGGVTVATGFPSSSITSGLTPPVRTAQMTQMQTKARFGVLGPAPGQFNSPHGFCLNETEEIAVADTNNHRVQVFALSGEFRCQFGVAGKEEGQLWYPRKIAYLQGNGTVPGRYIVCDRGSERSRMQIFSRGGHFIKKIAIRYIDIVAGLAIDSEGRIVAVDSVTPTVFCIQENGELVRWFDCADYMREPSDIAVSGHEYFVCDFKGHCVCVFSDSGNFLRRVGCEGITNYPNGIDVSDHGDVLIGDSHGNRFHVAVYRKSGELTCEFDCPYAKVSRCCGLRITRDGFIVTMAKNNHNVLVLNTLFVT